MRSTRLSTIVILRSITIASPKGERIEEVMEEYRNQTAKQVETLRAKWADKPDVAFDVIPQIGRRQAGDYALIVGGQVSKDPKTRDRHKLMQGVPLKAPSYADLVKEAA